MFSIAVLHDSVEKVQTGAMSFLDQYTGWYRMYHCIFTVTFAYSYVLLLLLLLLLFWFDIAISNIQYHYCYYHCHYYCFLKHISGFRSKHPRDTWAVKSGKIHPVVGWVNQGCKPYKNQHESVNRENPNPVTPMDLRGLKGKYLPIPKVPKGYKVGVYEPIVINGVIHKRPL